MDKQNYRAVIKHLFKAGKNASEIHRELVSIEGQDAPSLSTVQFWVRKFKCSQEELSDEPRSGRPVSAIDYRSIEEIANMVAANPRIGIRMMESQTNLSRGTIHTILHEHLNMQKMFAKWVPYELKDAQKQARMQVARRFLRQFGANFDDAKSVLITSDETWIQYSTPDTVESAREWRVAGSSRPEKCRVSPRCDKVMLTVWWDCKGVILLDFWKKSDQISFDAAYYQSLVRKLRKELPVARRGILKKGPLILVDNAPVHTAQETRRCFEECGFSLVGAPPYSPDLAPSDYYLFRNLKNWLRGTKFGSREELESAVSGWFESRPTGFYERGILQLPERMREVVRRGGAYLD